MPCTGSHDRDAARRPAEIPDGPAGPARPAGRAGAGEPRGPTRRPSASTRARRLRGAGRASPRRSRRPRPRRALDTIRVGRRTEAGTFDDAGGEPVRIVGAGRAATVLEGTLDLGEDRVVGRGLALRARPGPRSRCAAPATACGVDGGVRLRDGSALRSSSVAGPVVTAGRRRMHSVVMAGPGSTSSPGTLTARHLTVSGRARPACGSRPARRRPSRTRSCGASPAAFSGARRRDALAPAGVRRRSRASRAAGDLRLRPGSPLVDAGDPSPLGAEEPRDRRGRRRARDGRQRRRDRAARRRRARAPSALAPHRAATCSPIRAPSRARPRRTTPSSPAPPRWGAPAASRASATARSSGRSRSRRWRRRACSAPATRSSRAGRRARRASRPGRRRLALGARDRRPRGRHGAPVGAARRLPAERGPRGRVGALPRADGRAGSAASRSTR